MRNVFQAYLNGDEDYLCPMHDFLEPYGSNSQSRALVDYINYAVYQYGEHKYIYDEEKLALILDRLGFRSVTRSAYQEGIDPDSLLRRRYSFYVEAVK
jgi:hypothetical protein